MEKGMLYCSRIIAGALFALVCTCITPVAYAGIRDQVRFLGKLGDALMDSSAHTNEKPFEIPDDLPEPSEITDSIASHIDVKKFLRGASTCEHQCSTQCTPEICSWSGFAKERGLPQPADEEHPMDLWTHYRSYIDS